MKLYHISDLHIGRDFNSFDISEDQRFVLDDVIENIKKNDIKYLLIPGDIYDKFNPSDEAMGIYQDFIKKLTDNGVKAIIISGNHDSKEKVSYLSGYLRDAGIYVSSKIERLDFDEDKLSFLLIPYLHDSEVKQYLKSNYPDMEIEPKDYYRFIIQEFMKNRKEGYKNICLCHNFITGGRESKSERTLSVGGLEKIDAEVFECFDYTALGHLHLIQKIKDNIYYSGSIMKYSTSEFDNENSILEYDTIENKVKTIPLKQLRGTRKIKGLFENIIRNAETDPNREKDFIEIELEDENPVFDAFNKLEKYYPYIVQFRYSFMERKPVEEVEYEVSEEESPIDVFLKFRKYITGEDPREEEKAEIEKILEPLMEDDSK